MDGPEREPEDEERTYVDTDTPPGELRDALALAERTDELLSKAGVLEPGPPRRGYAVTRSARDDRVVRRQALALGTLHALRSGSAEARQKVCFVFARAVAGSAAAYEAAAHLIGAGLRAEELSQIASEERCGEWAPIYLDAKNRWADLASRDERGHREDRRTVGDLSELLERAERECAELRARLVELGRERDRAVTAARHEHHEDLVRKIGALDRELSCAFQRGDERQGELEAVGRLVDERFPDERVRAGESLADVVRRCLDRAFVLSPRRRVTAHCRHGYAPGQCSRCKYDEAYESRSVAAMTPGDVAGGLAKARPTK